MNRPIALTVLVLTVQLLACQIAYLFPGSTPTPTRTRTRTPTSVVKAPATPTVMVLVPTPPAPAVVAATAQENVRIRANPSTSAAILGSVKKGESVQVVGKTAASDWWQIILPSDPNATGWVSAEFATAEGPTDDIPIVQPGQSGPPASGGPVPPNPGGYPVEPVPLNPGGDQYP